MAGSKNKIIAFNYFGGKFTFLKELYTYFPPASKFHHLVEVFSGSMCVSLNYNHGQKIIKTANEINSDITNFFEVLRNHENELIKLLELTPCSKIEYDNCWECTEDKIEAARRFYVRVRQSFYGLGSGRKNKGWHMAVNHVHANGGENVSKWNNAIPKLREVAKIIRQQFQITPFDCIECIDKTDTPTTFFYCDPPYSKRSRASYNEYAFEFSDIQHEELAERLHRVKGLAMVSGYDCSLMNDLYHDWEKRYFRKKKNSIRSAERQEVVWTNYEPTRKVIFNTEPLEVQQELF